MNWGTQRTKIRTRLRDPGGVIWTNAQLLGYSDDVMEDIARNSEAHTKHVILPLVSGQRAYTLPDDCFEIRHIEINGRKIDGRQAYELEELDETYLTATGTPEFYYAESSDKVAFYKIPSWTATYTGTFNQELGEMARLTVDSTDATFTSELGCVIDIVTDSSEKYQIDQLVGIVTSLDTGRLVCNLSYTYQPDYLVEDTDTVDLAAHWQDIVPFGVLAQAFLKEGQGYNPRLAAYYAERYTEISKELFAKMKEWARGQDQITSQLPLSYSNERDWSTRSWR